MDNGIRPSPILVQAAKVRAARALATEDTPVKPKMPVVLLEERDRVAAIWKAREVRAVVPNDAGKQWCLVEDVDFSDETAVVRSLMCSHNGFSFTVNIKDVRSRSWRPAKKRAGADPIEVSKQPLHDTYMADVNLLVCCPSCRKMQRQTNKSRRSCRKVAKPRKPTWVQLRNLSPRKGPAVGFHRRRVR